MFPPMLATPGPLPSGPEWVFELKWDGVRVVATFDPGLRLSARSGTNVTSRYPELSGLSLPPGTVLDGEVVVLADGRPSFELLAERMHRDRPPAALAARLPVTYLIFDLPYLAGENLCELPYEERRARLDELGLAGPHWAVPPAFDDGPATYTASAQLGLEGVVAKRRTSQYRPGLRSADWVKCKNESTMDVLVGGWRPGARRLGALLVGTEEEEGLVFRGRVGGGISAATEERLLGLLEPLARPTSPFAEALPPEDRRGARWVEPLIVVEVAYGQLTNAGRLRFPRLRKVLDHE
ncbi:non-homologous end-joining DNA ligase [Longispora albida]|uniref:non-homologous end-joining DNA ligase n=1 Tax=Longispora albida TaxID=203523 RepID=UPI0003667EC8|nr:non-homologous end-joining DNA ligase [Longispora albida]